MEVLGAGERCTEEREAALEDASSTGCCRRTCRRRLPPATAVGCYDRSDTVDGGAAAVAVGERSTAVAYSGSSSCLRRQGNLQRVQGWVRST